MNKYSLSFFLVVCFISPSLLFSNEQLKIALDQLHSSIDGLKGSLQQLSQKLEDLKIKLSKDPRESLVNSKMKVQDIQQQEISKARASSLLVNSKMKNVLSDLKTIEEQYKIAIEETEQEKRKKAFLQMVELERNVLKLDEARREERNKIEKISNQKHDSDDDNEHHNNILSILCRSDKNAKAINYLSLFESFKTEITRKKQNAEEFSKMTDTNFIECKNKSAKEEVIASAKKILVTIYECFIKKNKFNKKINKEKKIEKAHNVFLEEVQKAGGIIQYRKNNKIEATENEDLALASLTEIEFKEMLPKTFQTETVQETITGRRKGVAGDDDKDVASNDDVWE